MKKRKQGRKLSRKIGPRKALIKGLCSELFLKQRIKTTEAKAREIRPIVEKMITRAKKADLSAQRHLLRSLSNKVVKKLIDEIGKKYKTRKGGYTRIIKLGPRKIDSAKMAIIELV